MQRGVGVERRLVRVRDLAGGAALESRGDEHRVDLAAGVVRAQVPDVGDVLDVQDLDPVVQHRPPDQVGEEERPQVADVGVAVDRRAAGVHPEPPGLDAARPGRRVRVSVSRRRSVMRGSFDSLQAPRRA